MGFLAVFLALSLDKAEWLRVGGDWKGNGLGFWCEGLFCGQEGPEVSGDTSVMYVSLPFENAKAIMAASKIYISSHYDSTENIQCATGRDLRVLLWEYYRQGG